MAIILNKTLLSQINRIILRFLWNGRKDVHDGHYLVIWPKVCRALYLGGLGVRDLNKTSIALRVRWLWL